MINNFSGIEFYFKEKYPEHYTKQNKQEVFINTSTIKSDSIDLRNIMNNIGILNTYNIEPTEPIRFYTLSYDDSEFRVSNTSIQDAFERLYREINRINE